MKFWLKKNWDSVLIMVVLALMVVYGCYYMYMHSEASSYEVHNIEVFVEGISSSKSFGMIEEHYLFLVNRESRDDIKIQLNNEKEYNEWHDMSGSIINVSLYYSLLRNGEIHCSVEIVE